MANQIPFSGATDAAGKYLLPPEQGEILTNAILAQAGAVALAGDAKSTTSRRTQFPIWLGQPTAAYTGEGAKKPVTGGEFGVAELNVKKVTSIVLFTDEMLEDVQGGDLNVLVDSGVRGAITDVIDANVIGKDSGADIAGAHDNMLRSTTSTVELGTTGDALRVAVSAAMGVLEANGYTNSANYGVLLASGFGQHIRDARSATDTTKELYDSDPVYGLSRSFSSNLNSPSAPLAAAGAPANIVGFVVHRPNIHVRLRKDVALDVSREATVNDGTVDRNMWEENLTGIRYETRLGVFTHDLNRAVVALVNAA
jgi:hypothetical protein